jgi:hypothetical protein
MMIYALCCLDVYVMTSWKELERSRILKIDMYDKLQHFSCLDGRLLYLCGCAVVSWEFVLCLKHQLNFLVFSWENVFN